MFFVSHLNIYSNTLNNTQILKEDIDNKAKAKKLRNKLKRDTKDQHKMTVLKMKIDSSNRVFEMKKEALQKSLAEKLQFHFRAQTFL